MKYDVCIVGSGAGGAPIAYELSHAGFSVIVLEKGPWHTEKDFAKDEILISRRSYFTPPLSQEYHSIETYNDDGSIEKTTGKESGWSFWNGSMVGGSSNLMSGYFQRMKPSDFKLKSSFGEIKGANIVDWAISYDELEPYYTKVEKVVGVSGRVVKHKFLEPRSTKDFPFTSTWEHPIVQWFDSACKELNYTAIPLPRAVLPHDALSRYGCSYSNFCGSYGCATGAKGNARAALLDSAVKTGNCTILADSFVYKLESNQDEITAVLYFDKYGKKRKVDAKIFVLSTQPIENVRLLLNSKNRYFPNGIANNSKEVGKNLIFSAGGAGEGRFEFKNLNEKKQKELMIQGAFVNRALQDWYNYKDGKKIIKGGTIDFLFEHANPTNRAMSVIYDDNRDLVWGEELQKKLRFKFMKSRIFTFEVFNDWLPTDKCFASVDKSEVDKWGVPVGKLRLFSHKHDIKIGEYLAKKAVNVLKKMGAMDITYNISSSPPPNLVAGGCRFGDNPKNSVLDKNCKSHELKNLYISDASFMPTGGSVPYTWTIYANSFRVADAILKTFRYN